MLLCYSRYDAALGAPVEFRDDQAGEADRGIKRLDLGQAVRLKAEMRATFTPGMRQSAWFGGSIALRLVKTEP